MAAQASIGGLSLPIKTKDEYIFNLGSMASLIAHQSEILRESKGTISASSSALQAANARNTHKYASNSSTIGRGTIAKNLDHANENMCVSEPDLNSPHKRHIES